MSRKPVEVGELKALVLRAIAQGFEGRPLNVDTAVRALSQAAFDLKMVHLKEVAELARK